MLVYIIVSRKFLNSFYIRSTRVTHVSKLSRHVTCVSLYGIQYRYIQIIHMCTMYIYIMTQGFHYYNIT